MNKFGSLFLKELKSLFTLQFILPLIALLVIFGWLGSTMGDFIAETTENATQVNLLNLDDTDYTEKLLTALEEDYIIDKKSADELKQTNINYDNKYELLELYKCDTLLVIPEGFSEMIKAENDSAPVEFITRLKSTSAMSQVSAGVSRGFVESVKNYISEETLTDGGVSNETIKFIEMPVYSENFTVVDKNYGNINVEEIISYITMQGIIIPIAVLMLIMFTSQLIISSISTEKIDKTLETLLSTPVSRSAIIWSKMLAAVVVAIVSGAIYMIGFNSFMGGVTDAAMSTSVVDLAGETISMQQMLENLGLAISPVDYLLIGAQMLSTILVALSCSMILGSLVNDAKSAQVVIMPITFASLIPYIISIVVDIHALPAIARYVIYAIPFTHTFIAMDNVVFGNWGLYTCGLGYQIIFFGFALLFVNELFTSDKILTISLNLGQKKKFRKNKNQNTSNED
jgi:ABC-2 type transport system permease protein